MILTKEFRPDQFASALASWSWLDLRDKQPVMTSLFADVFFVAEDGWWFLDSLEGTLTRHWSTADDCRAEINTDDGQDRFLLGGLAASAHRSGLVLGVDEVYDFKVPPLLGGKFSVDNVTKMDFAVALNIGGQLVRQLKDLPPGTRIGGIRVDKDP